MEEIVDRQLSTPSQSTALLSAFALLALLLAALGIYGVLSYAVAQRTNEIGVRMALGATSSEIMRSVGRRGLGVTLAGLAIGVVLTAVASRLMSTLLYGFRPDYVTTVAVVFVILVAVAALACVVPARRAARIDPTDCAAAGVGARWPAHSSTFADYAARRSASIGRSQAVIWFELVKIWLTNLRSRCQRQRELRLASHAKVAPPQHSRTAPSQVREKWQRWGRDAPPRPRAWSFRGRVENERRTTEL
jgi:FtsX-like permease family